jgi:hypothetical protein
MKIDDLAGGGKPHPYVSLGDVRQSRGGVYPRPRCLKYVG